MIDRRKTGKEVTDKLNGSCNMVAKVIESDRQFGCEYLLGDFGYIT